MRWRLGNDFNGLEGIDLCILALLRDHHRSASFEISDLPVDMPTLRLEKLRAVTNDNRSSFATKQSPGTTLKYQISIINFRFTRILLLGLGFSRLLWE